MADEHSTRHARSVTCLVCLGVRRDGAVEEDQRGGAVTEATAGLKRATAPMASGPSASAP